MCAPSATAAKPATPWRAPDRPPPPGGVSSEGAPPSFYSSPAASPKLVEVLKIFHKRMERWKITPSRAGEGSGPSGRPQHPASLPFSAESCHPAARRLSPRSARHLQGHPGTQLGWGSRPAEPAPSTPYGECATCASLNILARGCAARPGTKGPHREFQPPGEHAPPSWRVFLLGVASWGVRLNFFSFLTFVFPAEAPIIKRLRPCPAAGGP